MAAANYITVDATKRLGATLRNAVEVLRNSQTCIHQCKTIMDTQITSPSDYSVLEAQFGLPAGQGSIVYNAMVAVDADLLSANTQGILTRLG